MQSVAIQVIADMLITHPGLLAPDPESEDEHNPMLKPLTKTFIKALSGTDSIALMSCVAASKLLLLNILPAPWSTEVLKAFTMAFFNPETASNPALRQALSYFLPVFCHSQLRNAVHMSQIAVHIISKLFLMREELEEEDGEMVGWSAIAGMLAEWTDGRKVVGAELGVNGGLVIQGSEEPHVLLATEILERTMSNSCSKDERKPLLMLLGKLYIPPSVPVAPAGSLAGSQGTDEEALRTLHGLASEAVESKIGIDATSRNTLVKLENALLKRLGEVEHVVQSTEIQPDSREVSATGLQEGPVDGAMIVGALDEDDTLLANVQAEGTRFPLEDEGDESGSTLDEITVRAADDSVVDRLLESEIDGHG
jgi:condensin complex subunit 3